MLLEWRVDEGGDVGEDVSCNGIILPRSGGESQPVNICGRGATSLPMLERILIGSEFAGEM